MAITTTISTKELQRQAELCFEGETLKVMLCSVGISGFTAESTVADWQTVEQSGNGYVRFSEVIGAGEYDTTAAAYLLPVIDAEFTCETLAYSYDHVVIYVDGATYPHSILVETPAIVLSPGQTQTYRITLQQDD
jgi:hypothetical protein